MVASEAPEQQHEDRHRHDPGQLKSYQISLEKCVNGRAGRAPCSMGTLVVKEIVASETPERSISLKCVPLKRESNTQRSEIEPLIGGVKHQQHAKSMKSSLSLAQKTYIFQKSASTTLRCFTGYHFNTHKSRHCSGSTPFQTCNEKPYTGTRVPIEVLENVTFQQNWPRLCFWERGSGPGF